MKFTSAFLAGASLLMGVHGCEHCHPSEDITGSHVSPKEHGFDQSGAVYAQPYIAEGENNPDIYGYSFDPEYIMGAVDEDGDFSSSISSSTGSYSSAFIGNGQKQQEEQYAPASVINSLLGTDLPFPAIPALSSIEASLLSSVVPTGQAERSSFFAAVSSAIPTGTSAKSEFIASITSKVGGATDAAQFSSAVSGVLQDITSASSENVPTSTGSAQNTGASTTEGGNADSSAPGMDRGLVVAVTAVIVTVFMCSLEHVF